MEPEKITVWQRWIPDDFGGHFEHNHIEDGWVKNDQPIGSMEQTRQWANYEWYKERCYLVDGRVRSRFEVGIGLVEWERKNARIS